MNRGVRRNREGLAIMLLIAHMAKIGFDKIPPITLFSVIAQLLIYLRILIIPGMEAVEDVCISFIKVFYEKDWYRLIIGAIQHGDEWHLYYNMISMLWKGRIIEQKLGSVRFAGLLILFIPLVSLMLLLLIGLSDIIIGDPSSLTICHVGFSGVLFALKVVLTHQEPNATYYVLGSIPVPNNLVFWAELLLIHILVPNSSFLGHLAGILVGLWYVHGPLLRPIIQSLPYVQQNRGSSQYYEQYHDYSRYQYYERRPDFNASH